MSNTQFHKTCFAIILLNRDIYSCISYGVLPHPPKIKRNIPRLAIEMKNLIDFDEDPTPPIKATPTSKTKPVKKDLIPGSKTKKTQKKDLIPESKTKKKKKEKK